MSRRRQSMWPVAGLAACSLVAGCTIGGIRDQLTLDQPTRPITVEILALDLSTCGRCMGTDRSIETVVADLRPILAQAGVDLRFRKTVVRTVDQATGLRLRSSPTMRINGQDVPIELRESRCSDCVSLAGQSSGVDCRVWVWQGREYTEAPEGLVVDAILRAYARVPDPSSTVSNEPFELPENLKRFFAARARDRGEPKPCCAGPKSLE